MNRYRTLTAVLIALSAATSFAQAPAEKPTKLVVDPDKVRCKTITETGSLAKTNKICHTNAEWHALALQGQADAAQYRNVMNSSRGGN